MPDRQVDPPWFESSPAHHFLIGVIEFRVTLKVLFNPPPRHVRRGRMLLYQQPYELTHWNHSRLAIEVMVLGSSMRSFHALQQAVTMAS
jgi:hypothetical protein